MAAQRIPASFADRMPAGPSSSAMTFRFTAGRRRVKRASAALYGAGEGLDGNVSSPAITKSKASSIPASVTTRSTS
jgi:hypothetical protein